MPVIWLDSSRRQLQSSSVEESMLNWLGQPGHWPRPQCRPRSELPSLAATGVPHPSVLGSDQSCLSRAFPVLGPAWKVLAGGRWEDPAPSCVSAVVLLLAGFSQACHTGDHDKCPGLKGTS